MLQKCRRRADMTAAERRNDGIFERQGDALIFRQNGETVKVERGWRTA